MENTMIILTATPSLGQRQEQILLADEAVDRLKRVGDVMRRRSASAAS